MSKAMAHYGILQTLVLILLLGSTSSYGQKPMDDVLVTGDVTNIVLCDQDSDVRIYKLTIKLQAKNIGARAVIISAADAMADFYKFANTVEALNAKQYAHIGWVTSGSQGDPKTVPADPAKPFRVVAPNGSIDINVDFRAIVVDELKPGHIYVQVVAENWPDYSDDYVRKIRRSWNKVGNLWAHSLHSGPIAFVMPANLKQIRCP